MCLSEPPFYQSPSSRNPPFDSFPSQARPFGLTDLDHNLFVAEIL